MPAGCIIREDIFCERWLLNTGEMNALWSPEPTRSKQWRGRGGTDSSIALLSQRSSKPRPAFSAEGMGTSTAASPSMSNYEQQHSGGWWRGYFSTCLFIRTPLRLVNESPAPSEMALWWHIPGPITTDPRLTFTHTRVESWYSHSTRHQCSSLCPCSYSLISACLIATGIQLVTFPSVLKPSQLNRWKTSLSCPAPAPAPSTAPAWTKTARGIL